MQPADGFVGFNGMHRLALYPIWLGQRPEKVVKGAIFLHDDDDMFDWTGCVASILGGQGSGGI